MTLLNPHTVYTASDLARLPNARDYELVDGELVERHTSMESGRVAMKIGALLTVEADRTGEAESADDLASAVVTKVRDYLDHGFPLVWVAQPLDQTVTLYRPGQPPSTLSAGQAITAEPVLPAFRCDVALCLRSNARP